MRIILYAVVLSIGFALTCGCSKAPQVSASDNTAGNVAVAAVEQSDELAEKWGVKVEAVHFSAGGYMVDFRYSIVDAEKAKAFGDPAVKPYMIDQATGAKFIVPAPPKVGQLRNTKNLEPGHVYFIFFANPGRYVKPGNKITVVVGDCQIKDLVVE